MSSALLNPRRPSKKPVRTSRRGLLETYWRPTRTSGTPKEINVAINGGVFDEPEGLDEEAAELAGFDVFDGQVWHPDLGKVGLFSGAAQVGTLLVAAATPGSAARYAAFPELFLGYVPGFEYWTWTSQTPWPASFRIGQDNGSPEVSGPLPTDVEVPLELFDGPAITMGPPPSGTWWQLRTKTLSGALVWKQAWLCRHPASGVLRWYANPDELDGDLLPPGTDGWHFAPPNVMPSGTVKVIVQIPQ